MFKVKWVGLAILFIVFSTLFSQQTDFKVTIKTEDGKTINLYKECHALVIGVSDYLSGWPDLPFAESSVDEIGNVFSELGFTVAKVKNPTKDQLINALESLIYGPGQGAENCLVTYFTGHSHTRKLAYGSEIGCILPRDTPNPDVDNSGFMQKAIDMNSIEAYARKVESKHVIFIFDCPLASEAFFLFPPLPEAITSKTARPARQLITAGRGQDIIPDRNMFKRQIIEAFEGEADLNRDGYITGTELGKYLQETIENYSRNTQHPQYGKIRDPNLDKGDIVFCLEKMKMGETKEIQFPVESKPPLVQAEVFELVKKMGSFGSGEGQLTFPRGIAIDNLGSIHVVDTANNRIVKFTSEGEFAKTWGCYGTANGEFNRPWGIAADNSGYVYVADTENYRIQKFTSEGIFVSKWGSYGTADGEFTYPEKIAVDRSGFIYVVDSRNDRIQKFTSQGAFVTKWGSRGSANGEFLYPEGIAADDSGYIYVADSGNDRIQKFTAKGEFVAKWGLKGKGNGEFNFPEGIATGGAEFVYVADTWNYRIQKFTGQGVFAGKWGSRGSNDGNFYQAGEVAVDQSGYVYVVDTSNHRIQKFRPTLKTESLGKEGTPQDIVLSKEKIEEVKKEKDLSLTDRGIKAAQEAEDLGPVKLDSQIRIPKAVKKVPPKYPEIARQARIQGMVVLEVTIDTNGIVQNAVVSNSTNKIFNSSAIEAVKKWIFEPYIIGGQRRSATFSVIIKFELGKK